METLLGVKGKDFVMIAADSTHANSIIVLKSGKFNRNKHNLNILIRHFFFISIKFQMKIKSTRFPRN